MPSHLRTAVSLTAFALELLLSQLPFCPLSPGAQANVSAPDALALDASAPNDRLRSRLERIFYEQDLLVRNASSELADLRHQEREIEELKVYERIPFAEDLPGLHRSLSQSARAQGLELDFFAKRALSHAMIPPPVPARMYSDENPSFNLTDEQLARQIPFTAVVRGPRAAVLRWIRSWPDEQIRLAETDTREAERSIKAIGPGRWAVRAHAFSFRKEVRFPTLEPRDPLTLLPTWAKSDPNRFAREQPALWSLVQRAQAVSPQARPLYRVRERMQLNNARLSLFLTKAMPSPQKRPAQ